MNYGMRRRKCPARVEVELTTDKEGRKGQSSEMASELRTRGCKEGCGAKRMKEHLKQWRHPAWGGFLTVPETELEVWAWCKMEAGGRGRQR